MDGFEPNVGRGYDTEGQGRAEDGGGEEAEQSANALLKKDSGL